MHTVFFTPAFPPFIGGGERYARSLALALAARGLPITVVTSQARREQELWLGAGSGEPLVTRDGPLTVIRCPVSPMPGGWRGLLAWRKTMTLLSRLPGDQTPLLKHMARRVPALHGVRDALSRLPAPPALVHGFNLSWEHTALIAGDVARQHTIPFVLTPFMHFGSAPTGGRRALTRRMALNSTMDHQRRLLGEARAVLALTGVERRGLEQWSIAARRVVVVGGGVEPPPPLGDAQALLRHYALEEPFALFVGRINRDKGAIDAARATLRLAQQGRRLTLALVGRPARDFERFCQGLSDAERASLRLLGAVDEETKHALMQRAAMLLLPSQAESLGIVLLEAWLHGTPVVAARAGGIPGVVDEGQNGLLAPYGDVRALSRAMARLLDDPALARALGRRGREKVQREYTWDAVADRVLAAYQRARD